MRTTLKPHISSAVLIPLVAVVLAGCASVLNEIAAEIGDLAGCEVEIPRLSLPLTHSGCPDRSTSFSQLNYYATDVDVSAFPEQFPIISEGLSGQPRTIAFVPMMEIASLEGRSLVERHFRPPVENELPLLVIKAVPNGNGIALIALESKSSVRAKISCRFSIVDALEKSHVLFAKDYEATATEKWSDGAVPDCVFSAMHRIVEQFLDDCAKEEGKLTLLVQQLIVRKTGSMPRMPELKTLNFDTNKGNREGTVVVGRCVVACNDWEGFRTEQWAKRQIFKSCVSHLGIEADRVRVRYSEEETKFDPDGKSWTLVFSTWARTEMAMQYDKTLRTGKVFVDLDLFKGTAAQAAQAANDYIRTQMNIRAANYSDDAPPVTAEIEFGSIQTSIEDNLHIYSFKLVY